MANDITCSPRSGSRNSTLATITINIVGTRASPQTHMGIDVSGKKTEW